MVHFYELMNKKILDYGCGLGMFAELFSRYSSDVSGCDLSTYQLKRARILTNANISYFEDDFFNSKLNKNQFDYIFCRDLGPLQKIEYDERNAEYLKNLVNALNDDGVGYFILMHNLSGKPDKQGLSGFKNHRLETIYDFFSRAGHIAMINVFGYQAVIVTKNSKKATYYNGLMHQIVYNGLKNLLEYDEAGFLKYYFWLYINNNIEIMESLQQLANFSKAKEFAEKYCNKYLVDGLVQCSRQKKDA